MASNTVIRTNVLALNSHRNLGLVGTQKEKSSQRLSSGYRINSAADDAAGLAISEKMRAQIRGLDMANKNTQDGISLIQTAEGGMAEIDEMVQRIRELVVYAANDTAEQDSKTNIQGDRQKIQDEINQLMQEIDSMASRVEFNKKRLIDGTYAAGGVAGAFTTSTGVQSAFSAVMYALSASLTTNTNLWTTASESYEDKVDSAELSLTDLAAALRTALDAGNITSARLSVSNLITASIGFVSVMTTADFERVVSNIRDAITSYGANAHESLSADVTGALNVLTADSAQMKVARERIAGVVDIRETMAAASAAHTAANKQISAMNSLSAINTIAAFHAAFLAAQGANAALTEAEFMKTYTEPAWANLVSAIGGSGGGQALWFQLGANAGQGMFLNINGVTTRELFNDTGRQHIDAQAGRQITSINVMDTTGNAAGVIGDDIPENGSITGLLKRIDNALTIVTTERAKLGAAQNRLEYTGNSLKISSENLSSAESRVRNTDMGKEMMSLTQANILQQAAISMLAQGNQQPQSILQLLQ